MNRVFLDTNAYSHLIKGDRKILEILLSSEEVHMSLFVIGELLYGFRNGKNYHENEEILNSFLKKPSVRISIPTKDTAVIYSQIRLELKNAGKPIPENDIWIASLARETGCWLISYDNHFRYIPGLLHYDPSMD